MDANDRMVGRALQRAREDAGMEQEEVAKLIDRSRVTVSRWENGYPVPDEMVAKLIGIYEKAGAAIPKSLSMLLDVSHETSTRLPMMVRERPADDAWSPNPALSGQIPQRAYEVALGHLRRLAAAGIDRDQIEEAERLMIDRRFAKANKRERRELSEDDWILLVDDTWDAIREALSWKGVKV